MTLLLKEGILPMNFLLYELVISYVYQTGLKKIQDSRRQIKMPKIHYGKTLKWRITKSLLTFGISMFNSM